MVVDALQRGLAAWSEELHARSKIDAAGVAMD
jgi:hypothetical protein